MGRIFVLSGPSGVGKTTFLQQLTEKVDKENLHLLPRYTDRPRRDNEDEGFEHYFASHHGLLQKVFANDFIHVEKWGDYYSAIESRIIEETIASPYDGILLTSVFGAARLRATYGGNITSVYMWAGTRESLLNPRCMEDDCPEVYELKWRIRKKLVEDGFSEYETTSLSDDQFITKRMVDNYLDIAAVNGRLRSGEDIIVLPNFHDCMNDTVNSFITVWEQLSPVSVNLNKRRGSGCFVLMPFREELQPVYEDHIVKVCESLGITVTRADQIFSVRPIMEDILESVLTARFIIGDLTDRNPNVFYEIGICHALGKKVILITQESDVPFDLMHLRHIKYSYTPRGIEIFEEALTRTLEALLIS